MSLSNKQLKELQSLYKNDKSYLVDAMLDLLDNGHTSACIGIVIKQDDPTFLGAPIGDQYNHAFKMIGDQTTSYFSRITAAMKNGIKWQNLVSFGIVPEFFDKFRETIELFNRWIIVREQLPEEVANTLFAGYVQQIRNYASDFFDWIKQLLIKAGVSISNTLNATFEYAVNITSGVIQYMGRIVSAVLSAIGTIITGIYAAVEYIQDLIYGSVTYMSYGSMTMLEAMTNQDNRRVQKYAAKAALFLLSCQEEVLSYTETTSLDTRRKRVRSMMDEWTKVVNDIRDFYNDGSLDTKGLNSFFMHHWITDGVLSWISTIEESIKWVVEKLIWLVSMITSNRNSTQVAFDALLRQAPVIFKVVLPKLCINARRLLGKEKDEEEDKPDPEDTRTDRERLIDDAIEFAYVMKKQSESAQTDAFNDYISREDFAYQEAKQTRENILNLLKTRQEEAQRKQYDSNSFNSQWTMADELSSFLVDQDYDASALLSAYEMQKGTSLLLEIEACKTSTNAMNLQSYMIMRNVYIDQTSRDAFQVMSGMPESISGGISDDLVEKVDYIMTKEEIAQLTSEQIITRLKLLFENTEEILGQRKKKTDRLIRTQTTRIKINEEEVEKTTVNLLSGASTNATLLLELLPKNMSQIVPRTDLQIMEIARVAIYETEEDANDIIDAARNTYNEFVKSRNLEIERLQTQLRKNGDSIHNLSQTIAGAIFIGAYGWWVLNDLIPNFSFSGYSKINYNDGSMAGVVNGTLVQLQADADKRMKELNIDPKTVGWLGGWVYSALSIFSFIPNAMRSSSDYFLTSIPTSWLSAIDGILNLGDQVFRALQIREMPWQGWFVPFIYLTRGGYVLLFTIASSVFGTVLLPFLDFGRDALRIVIAYQINQLFYKDPRAEYSLMGLFSQRRPILKRTAQGYIYEALQEPISQAIRTIIKFAVWKLQFIFSFPSIGMRFIPKIGNWLATGHDERTLGTLNALAKNMVASAAIVDERFDELTGKNKEVVDSAVEYWYTTQPPTFGKTTMMLEIVATATQKQAKVFEDRIMEAVNEQKRPLPALEPSSVMLLEDVDLDSIVIK